MTEPELSEADLAELHAAADDPTRKDVTWLTAGGPVDPMYVRLLRLRNIYPRPWQRAFLVEGSIIVAILLVMADLASAWVLLALPVGVAVMVKFHDLLQGLLRMPHERR